MRSDARSATAMTAALMCAESVSRESGGINDAQALGAPHGEVSD